MCSLACRLCLSESAELYNILSVMYDGVQGDIVLQEIFNIKVTNEDGFSVMCPTCKLTLGEFYKFFNVVKRSQAVLAKKLTDGSNEVDEAVDIHNYTDYSRLSPIENDYLSENSLDSQVLRENNEIVSEIQNIGCNIVEHMDLTINKDPKDTKIGVKSQTNEIEVKLDSNITGKLQTIDVSNLPNKVVVKKISNNFKIINNASLKKVTRIIVAKNIPPNLLKQENFVKHIVNNIVIKKEPAEQPPPSDYKDESDEDDEVLSKVKKRLIKHKVHKRTPKKSVLKKKVPMKIIKVKQETLEHKEKKTRIPARSKEQLARLLKQIEEEKKVKEAQKISKTYYEPGPEYDPIVDVKINENDSDIEFSEENRKLTPMEVDQVYRNGKLIAEGADLEMLYRRIFGLQCEICDRKFTTLSSLFGHYKEIHKGLGFVRCCKSKFFARHSVNRHLIKHIRPRSVECPICKKVISRKKSLGVHMQVHLPMDQRRFQCGQCKLGFTHSAQLNHHVARKHSDLTPDELYECDICFKKFTTKPVHDLHKKSVHKEATDLCQECGKKFKTVASLNAHIKRVHTVGGDPRMKCPHCTSVCKKSNLKTHIKTVHDLIKKPCPHCGQLVFPKSMRSHIKHKHDSGIMYPCDFCEKKFKCEKYLKFHVVQHTGVPNYVCEYCPKTFASSGNYHTHRKRVHKRELERIHQEKLLHQESVPVYNPDEETNKRGSKNIKCDPELLQSIRYKNPTIFTVQPEDGMDQHHAMMQHHHDLAMQSHHNMNAMMLREQHMQHTDMNHPY